jgi:hypothetical protein
MKQTASLTIGILMSLYPQDVLGLADDGFATTCIGEEALKLVEDSALTVDHIVDMVSVDMS